MSCHFLAAGIVTAARSSLRGRFVVDQPRGRDETYRYPCAMTFAIATGVTGAAAAAAGIGLYLPLRGPHPTGATASMISGETIVGWKRIF
jgi:hypothetical protein